MRNQLSIRTFRTPTILIILAIAAIIVPRQL